MEREVERERKGREGMEGGRAIKIERERERGKERFTVSVKEREK